MKKILRNRIIQILIIIFALSTIVFSLYGCEPTNRMFEAKTIEDNNMTFIGRVDEIQVWKFHDGSTICYIAVNANSYQAAGIFCK